MKSHLVRVLRSLFFLSLAGFASARTAPNIVFVLSDDQGYGDLGCYGSTRIKTPNIDSLRDQGIKFDSFYVHNRCSPTRAAFMTGCHAQRVDMGKVIYRKDRSGLNSEEITVAELLQSAGYATGLVGKWHLGEWPQFNPLHHGFDSFVGRFSDAEGKSSLFENLEKVGDWGPTGDRFSSRALLPAGIEFMRTHKDEPFFLFYASNIPHSKWLPQEEFKGSSEQGAYGDCVQQLDWEVGELLAELEALGLREDTLVVFASDNGPQLNSEGHGSAGALRDGKWTDFEGGIRVPCVMSWPGKIPAGASNDEIVGIIDLLPTFCELAGVEVPQDRIIDGKSLLPYLLGPPPEEPIHERFIVPGSVIRDGDWKLLVKSQKPGGGLRKGRTDRVPAAAGALFNLGEDLSESRDVSMEHPEKASQLADLMAAYMKDFKKNVRPREQVLEDVE